MRESFRPETPTSAPAATAAATLSSGCARIASAALILSIAAAKSRFASSSVGLADISLILHAARRRRGAGIFGKSFRKRVYPRHGEHSCGNQSSRWTPKLRCDCCVKGEAARESRGEEKEPAEEKQKHTLRKYLRLRTQFTPLRLDEFEKAEDCSRNPVHGIPWRLVFSAVKQLRSEQPDAERYRKRRAWIFPHLLRDAAQQFAAAAAVFV